jgi:hypothetical protein
MVPSLGMEETNDVLKNMPIYVRVLNYCSQNAATLLQARHTNTYFISLCVLISSNQNEIIGAIHNRRRSISLAQDMRMDR